MSSSTPHLRTGLATRAANRFASRRRQKARRFIPTPERLERIRLLTTWTVNSSDTSGTNDPAEMTLYDALYYANQAGGGTIDFDIVAGTTFTDPNDSTNTWTNGSGPYLVTPIDENKVTVPVTIDGATQPGSQPGQPQIYLDGDIPNASANLLIDGGNSTIEGLGFIKGIVLGLNIHGGDLVQDCVFGIGPGGQAATNEDAFGVAIGSAKNTIGGTTAADANFIAGATITGNTAGSGVDIFGATATGNVVEGNRIGTGLTGTTAIPNQDGILIEQGASNNTIGGMASGASNLISGNTVDGILITGTGTNDNVVEGNLIGTIAGGTAALANAGDGVLITSGAQDNRVGGNGSKSGGVLSGAGNVISANGMSGVELQGTGSSFNDVQGNYIGTNAAGSARVPNAGNGVLIDQGSTNDVVGGSGDSTGGNISGLGNLISGNTGSGVMIEDQGTGAVAVTGNDIGTDASGVLALGNGGDGVTIEMAASNNFIGGVDTNVGGSLAGLGNLISANTGNGILITGTGATGMQVEGNFIGTDVTGASTNLVALAALRNGADGIQINQGASRNTIGALASGTGNLLSNNASDGVLIAGSGTNNNTIEGNLIGTNVTGAAAMANIADGVQIDSGASDNVIGGASSATSGTLSGAGNVISGNGANGIEFTRGLTTGSNSNTVEGNFIGTDNTGTKAIANQQNGIRIVESSANLIGGTSSGTGNVVSGNGALGIAVVGPGTPSAADPGADNNVIIGNIIGLNDSREASLGNTGGGIAIEQAAAGNLIGASGNGNLEGNVISGNGGDGVLITGAHATQNVVEATYIGTDGMGQNALPNTSGVLISAGASNNTIGGKAKGAGNVISGNSQAGVVLTDPGTTANLLINNSIGTELSTGTPLANRGPGVLVENQASSNQLGGSGAGNVISGNLGDGIDLIGSGTSLNNIFDNMIGVNSLNTFDVPNGGAGVLIQNAANNHIGGTFGSSENEGNTIAGNNAAGVSISGAGASGDSVLDNNFADNGGLPIDLENGANQGINPPLFTVEVGKNGGGGLTEEAQVPTSSGTYEIQFYWSPSRSSSTLLSQTANYVGSSTVVLSGTFLNVDLQGPPPGDTFTLMTLTNQNGSTSEFSFSLANGTLLDQGMHLQGGSAEETIKENKSVIIVNQTLTVTDIININRGSSQAIEAVRIEQTKPGKPKGKVTATGTVYFDLGNALIGKSNVKIVHGVAQAQVKLKLKTLGTQTIFAVYEPDAKALANGLTPGFTSFTVTVDPAPPGKKGHGKPKDVLLGIRALSPARAIPAGPRALVHHR